MWNYKRNGGARRRLASWLTATMSVTDNMRTLPKEATAKSTATIAAAT